MKLLCVNYEMIGQGILTSPKSQRLYMKLISYTESVAVLVAFSGIPFPCGDFRFSTTCLYIVAMASETCASPGSP